MNRMPLSIRMTLNNIMMEWCTFRIINVQRVILLNLHGPSIVEYVTSATLGSTIIVFGYDNQEKVKLELKRMVLENKRTRMDSEIQKKRI